MGTVFKGGERASKSLSSTLLPVFKTTFLILVTIIFANRPLITKAIIKEVIIVMISMWSFNAAYHIAGKYSSIISPFFFTQIIWGSLYGIIFFSEKINSLSIIGIVIIIVSGTIAIYNRKK